MSETDEYAATAGKAPDDGAEAYFNGKMGAAVAQMLGQAIIDKQAEAVRREIVEGRLRAVNGAVQVLENDVAKLAGLDRHYAEELAQAAQREETLKHELRRRGISLPAAKRRKPK